MEKRRGSCQGGPAAIGWNSGPFWFSQKCDGLLVVVSSLLVVTCWRARFVPGSCLLLVFRGCHVLVVDVVSSRLGNTVLSFAFDDVIVALLIVGDASISRQLHLLGAACTCGVACLTSVRVQKICCGRVHKDDKHSDDQHCANSEAVGGKAGGR